MVGMTARMRTVNALIVESRLLVVTRQSGAHTHQLRAKLADGSLVTGLAEMIPHPTNYESALSLLTFAIGCIEAHAPTTKDEADRLNWAVQRLDRAAVKAAGSLKEEKVW